MHELSIAQSLVETVCQYIQQNDCVVEARDVKVLHLRLGALSCVHPESLRFCFQVVTEGTSLEEARLKIEILPVAIYCSQCDAIVSLPSIQSFRCPTCHQPSTDLRQGKEMELMQIEFDASSRQEISIE